MNQNVKTCHKKNLKHAIKMKWFSWNVTYIGYRKQKITKLSRWLAGWLAICLSTQSNVKPLKKATSVHTLNKYQSAKDDDKKVIEKISICKKKTNSVTLEYKEVCWKGIPIWARNTQTATGGSQHWRKRKLTQKTGGYTKQITHELDACMHTLAFNAVHEITYENYCWFPTKAAAAEKVKTNSRDRQGNSFKQ